MFHKALSAWDNFVNLKHIFIRTVLKAVILNIFFITLLCAPKQHKSTPIFLTKINNCHT